VGRVPALVASFWGAVSTLDSFLEVARARSDLSIVARPSEPLVSSSGQGLDLIGVSLRRASGKRKERKSPWDDWHTRKKKENPNCPIEAHGRLLKYMGLDYPISSFEVIEPVEASEDRSGR
jgi:hypothetical protein